MAVQEQTPLREYTANGVTTSFALGFDCEETNHLIVTIDDVEVLPTDWYLSGSNVVFWTAPGNGKLIKLQRNTPFNRLVDYQSYNNSFRPPAINKEFDRIWWKLQELGVADWILHNRIDALKAYVDDRDDELRAYLMEEIRKQGVALDQLDEYYNYLMQRLAQIAVDKGWDASFVVSAGGDNQQEINDRGGSYWREKPLGYDINSRVMLENGDIVKSTVANNTADPNFDMTGWILESDKILKKGAKSVISIAELKNEKPLQDYQLVYVLSRDEGTSEGGGYFVWQAENTLAENGGTVFTSNHSATGRWVRLYYKLKLEYWGVSRGRTDNHIPMQAAIDYLNALGGGYIEVSEGTYEYSQDIYSYAKIKIKGQAYKTVFQGRDAAFRISGAKAGIGQDFFSLEDINFKRVGTVKGDALVIGSYASEGAARDQYRFDLKNIRVSGSTGRGLVLLNSYIANIYNFIARQCVDEGLFLDRDDRGSGVGVNAVSFFGGELQFNGIGAKISHAGGVFMYGTCIEGNQRVGLELPDNSRQFCHIGGYYEGNKGFDVKIGELTSGYGQSFRDCVFWDGGNNKDYSIILNRSISIDIENCNFVGYQVANINHAPLATNSVNGRVRRCKTIGSSTPMIANENYYFHRDLEEAQLKATASHNIPAVPAMTSYSFDVAVEGASLGDSVQVTSNAGMGNGGILHGYVSVAGTVKITLFNPTAATIDPLESTYRILVTPRSLVFAS